MKNNETIRTIRERRSIRRFSGCQLSKEDLETILEAGAYAPNGMHYETWHLTAVQNPELLKLLNEKIKEAFRKSDSLMLQERGANPDYCCYYHAPVLVIVSNTPDQWWAAMDCACANENMFLAAKSLGIGSCWINQLGTTCNDPEVRSFLTRLGVPENHQVYACAALGYADATLELKEKKLKDNVYHIVE